MTDHDTEALIRRYYNEVFNERRPELIEQLAVEDYIEHDPFPGQGNGRGDLTARVQLLLDALNPIRFTVEDVVVGGDRVVVRWTQTSTQSAPFLGLPATGRTATFAGIDIHGIRDGRMAEHWHVVDMFSMLQQLGAIPVPSGSA